MPNFDGTGPLKRGRVIGRGLGPCKTCEAGCHRKPVPGKRESGEGKRAA